MDKHRAGTKSEDLLSIQQHISYQNQRLKNQVDSVFTQRKNFEDKIMKTEQQIKELKNFAEIKINELGADEREEYKKLVIQVKEAEQSIKMREQKLAEVDKQLIEKENQLRMDNNRIRYFNLKDDIEQSENKKKELEEKLKDASLSFEEIRKKLMEKVKNDKKEIRALERRAKEVKKLTDNTERKLNNVKDLLNNDNQITDQQKQKYAILYEKEKELDEFINNYNDNRSNKLEELNKLEENNIKLLEGINKNNNLVKHVPSAQEFEEMSKEYNYKKIQAENSEQTLKRVQTELLRRQDALSKVDDIEQTLPERIAQLNEHLENIRVEIAIFENVDEEKQKIVKRTENLKKKIERINNCLNSLKENYETTEAEYNRKLRELGKHPYFNKFVHLEKQLSQTNQLHFSLQDYIKVKEDEQDFANQIEEIESICDQINTTLVK